MSVCCECCVLSICDEVIRRPEESYRLWCVVCDLGKQTSWMTRPRPTMGVIVPRERERERERERAREREREGDMLDSKELGNGPVGIIRNKAYYMSWATISFARRAAPYIQYWSREQ